MNGKNLRKWNHQFSYPLLLQRGSLSQQRQRPRNSSSVVLHNTSSCLLILNAIIIINDSMAMVEATFLVHNSFLLSFFLYLCAPFCMPSSSSSLTSNIFTTQTWKYHSFTLKWLLLLLCSNMGLLRPPFLSVLCCLLPLLCSITKCGASDVYVKFLKVPHAFSHSKSATFAFRVLNSSSRGHCSNCTLICKVCVC